MLRDTASGNRGLIPCKIREETAPARRNRVKWQYRVPSLETALPVPAHPL
jgi:ribosomal protein S30